MVSPCLKYRSFPSMPSFSYWAPDMLRLRMLRLYHSGPSVCLWSCLIQSGSQATGAAIQSYPPSEFTHFVATAVRNIAPPHHCTESALSKSQVTADHRALLCTTTTLVPCSTFSLVRIMGVVHRIYGLQKVSVIHCTSYHPPAIVCTLQARQPELQFAVRI